LYRDRFDLYRLLLMAVGLGFTHPFTNKQVHVAAPLDEEVRRVLRRVFGEMPGCAVTTNKAGAPFS
jgi:hypothetical protein